MTTTGIACGQLQSSLKFRSSLFKGLAGNGAAAPKKACGAWGNAPIKSFFTEIIEVKQAIADLVFTEIKSCCITF